MVKILSHPDSALNTAARKVEDVSLPEVQAVIDEMIKTLYSTDNCAGLAATQLDFDDPLAITVIDISDEKNDLYCLINPEIIEHSDEQVLTPEGCMSVFPAYVAEPVKRYEQVTVKALNRDGKQIEIKASGYLARALQHEIDHLDGILYIDRLSKLKRQRVDKKIQKVKRYLASEKKS